MANTYTISKIELPNGDICNLKAGAYIFEGVCDTAAATVNKEVICADFTESDLVIGAKIFVTFSVTNTGAVANLTLNVNDTGAKNIKKVYNAAINNLVTTGELQANVPILFVYNGTYWIAMGIDYNNTYTLANNYIGANGSNFIANSVLYRYQLLFQIDENQFTPLNNVSNSTATTKTILTDVEFDPLGLIFYYNSTTTVAANAAIRADYCYYSYSSFNLAYSLNISSSVNTLTAAKNVYLKVIPQSNGKVKLASAAPTVQALPETNDGYWYILLGRAVSATNIALFPNHPVYYHDGTNLRVYDGNLDATTTKSGYMSASDKSKLDTIPESKITSVSIEASDWEGTSPYTYTLTDSFVTSNTVAFVSLDNTYYNLYTDLTITTNNGAAVFSTAVKPANTFTATVVFHKTN